MTEGIICKKCGSTPCHPNCTEVGLSTNSELLCCKKCGGNAVESFCDNLDLHVTVHAVIECSECDNESETFTLPDDQSIGNAKMGILVEELARLHWNMINAT